jgi:tight adherence protein C
MTTLLISFLVGLAVICLGGGALLVLQQRRQARLVRARALSPDGANADLDAEAAGETPALAGTVQRVGHAVSRSGTSRNLAEQLARAGYHGASAPAIYLGSKILLFLAGLMISLPVALALDAPFQLRFFLVALLSCGLSFVPNFIVSWKRGKRSTEVRNHLPDAVDMLEICVSAGMGLDAAWTAVTDEIRRVSTVFADEMELTNLEMSLGVPRAVAMRHMANRTGADDLSSLVALLVQSERFGAGIVEALTTFARTMRETRSQRAEETAEKLSVKLLFPMVMFIFPALLIVMVGPAVLELAKVLWTH